ncbi:MAG: hypothetical protein CMH52_14185 [Myxococcales bacterium]|nr:hypothetical protein [Myxococcales bacterium]|tara:strand:- start:587 stop:847 length:261 start_codon:yes stop_codon:yes gene_type:complete
MRTQQNFDIVFINLPIVSYLSAVMPDPGPYLKGIDPDGMIDGPIYTFTFIARNEDANFGYNPLTDCKRQSNHRSHIHEWWSLASRG